MPKTIAFFGASGGCGLAALKKAVAAGHTCIALCRSPAKLDPVFPSRPPNLLVKPGNAHNADDVAACLVNPADPARLVDNINSSIGSAFSFAKMSTEDPDVCRRGMQALFDALGSLRARGLAGAPLISVVSTTGISAHQRDVPLAVWPFFHFVLKVPHVDKKAMEDMLVASSERYVFVRPSLLTDGEKPERKIRVGLENQGKGVEKKETGYFISREDVGRWMYEELLNGDAEKYVGKAVSLTW